MQLNDDLAAASDAVHDAVPAGWTVQRPSRHDEERERPWHVFATDLRQRVKRREHRRGDRLDGRGGAA